ncbi:GTP-binding protein [Candidatus Magnetoovum chiemensis]|nr:GTP-binding protein [Candidatus Magnetoovum chiemensis]
MGRPAEPEQALLFAGLLYADVNIFKTVVPILEKTFGTIYLLSDELRWNYSNYYADELGQTIMRRFAIFKTIISANEIVQLKLRSNDIEASSSINGKRTVNIDPGYITSAKIVLATTKNYSHRIYLNDGIYGEVTLYYKHNNYVPHIFTYADYKEDDTIAFLIKGRNYLKSAAKTSNMI